MVSTGSATPADTPERNATTDTASTPRRSSTSRSVERWRPLDIVTFFVPPADPPLHAPEPSVGGVRHFGAVRGRILASGTGYRLPRRRSETEDRRRRGSTERRRLARGIHDPSPQPPGQRRARATGQHIFTSTTSSSADRATGRPTPSPTWTPRACTAASGRRSLTFRVVPASARRSVTDDRYLDVRNTATTLRRSRSSST